MQLNTLNRVISLFLVGGFVIVLTALSLRGRVGDLLTAHKLDSAWGPAAGVFLAVGLLSATALAGFLVDAVSNVTVRRFIRKWAAQSEKRARLFACTGEYRNADRWETRLNGVLRGSRYRDFVGNDSDDTKAFAAGLFFRTAEKEQTEWLIQHYSMYNLAAGFVVVLLFTFTVMLFKAYYIMAAISIVGGYLLATLSLDNYLYTYFLVFRNAYLELEEGSGSEEADSRGEPRAWPSARPLIRCARSSRRTPIRVISRCGRHAPSLLRVEAGENRSR